MTIIDKLFKKSPFKPLVEHAGSVLECVDLIETVVESWFSENWDEIEKLKERMSDKEKKADEIKIGLRENLPKSLFLPVPRGDLMRILDNQDNIADTAEDLCVLLVLRKTVVPDELKENVRYLVRKCMEACQAVLNVTEDLDLLIQSSFSGLEAKKVIETANKVDRLEYEADNIEQNLVKKLFQMEGSQNPVTIMFCMKIFETIGMLANHAENCGDNLRHLIICRS
jgi:uncharacterized protein